MSVELMEMDFFDVNMQLDVWSDYRMIQSEKRINWKLAENFLCPVWLSVWIISYFSSDKINTRKALSCFVNFRNFSLSGDLLNFNKSRILDLNTKLLKSLHQNPHNENSSTVSSRRNCRYFFNNITFSFVRKNIFNFAS